MADELKLSLARSVARIIRDRGLGPDNPLSPVSVVWALRVPGEAILREPWAHRIPAEILDQWERLPDEFRMGCIAVACCAGEEASDGQHGS